MFEELAMAMYTEESTFVVRPFIHRSDGDEVVVADVDGRVYLALTPDGLDLLEWLAAGRTVAEAVQLYEDKYHETPDIDDFLREMVGEGFVQLPGADATVEPFDHARPFRHSWSLDWIAPKVAKKLASWPVVVGCLLVSAFSIVLIVLDPGLVPPSTVYLFLDGHFNLFTMIILVVTLFATYVHELAHAVVARANGVPVKLGFGNLLFSPVAQTHVSGLWMAPKRQRLLAYAGGAVTDLVGTAVFVFLLYADRRGIYDLPAVLVPLMGALLLTYMFRLLFQSNFSIRTDVYYAIADGFNCRNLMVDTEVMLRNVFHRLTGRKDRVVDQSSIPRRERRVIRGYAVAYILGRLIALWALFFLFVPVLFGLLRQFVLLVLGEPAILGWGDFLTVGLVIILINGGGIALWIYSIFQGRQRRIARRRRVAALADGPHDGQDVGVGR